MPLPNLQQGQDPVLFLLEEIKKERLHIPAPILRQRIHMMFEGAKRDLNNHSKEDILDHFFIALTRHGIQAGFDLVLACSLIYAAYKLHDNNEDNLSTENVLNLVFMFVMIFALAASTRLIVADKGAHARMKDDKYYIDSLINAYKQNENLPQGDAQDKFLNMWELVQTQLRNNAKGDTYSNPVSINIHELENEYRSLYSNSNG